MTASPDVSPSPARARPELADALAERHGLGAAAGTSVVELDADGMWLVVAGLVDLFAAPVELDAAEPWTHLARLGAGCLLGGAAPIGGIRLIARATPDSELVEVVPARLGDVADRSPELVAGAVDPLLEAFGAHLGADASEAPRIFIPLRPGTTALERVPIGRPIDGLVWLTAASAPVTVHRRGDIEPYDPADADRWMAITELDWVEADAGTTLVATSTEQLVTGPGWRDVLGRELAEILEDTVLVRRTIQEDDTERVAERAARDRELLHQADLRFGAVLAGIDRHRAIPATADPAFAATSLVGDQLGIEVLPARAADLRRGTDAIGAIASASRFRTRTVRLEAAWYRDDVGPLVGFLKESMKPIALLRRANGYVINDPTAATITPVDPESARQLHIEARMLYPSLSGRAVSGRDLLRFGLRGSRVDVGVLVLSSIAVALFSLLTPILTGNILGQMVPQAQSDLIAQASILLLVIAVLVGVISQWQNLAALRIEGRVDVNAQAGVWDRLMALPARFFRQYSIGALSSAALGINGIRDAVSGLAVQAALAFVTGIANLGLMLWYDLMLGLFALAVVAAGFGVSIVAGRRQVRQQRAVLKENNEVASSTFQLMTGIAKLRVAAAENRAYTFWSGKFASMRTRSYAARTTQNRLVVFNAGYAVLAPGLIFAYIGIARAGQFPLATFLSFNVAFVLFLGATLQLSSTGITVLSIVPLFEQLRPILETVPEVDADKLDPGELSGAIEVSHITFGYHTDEPPVLQDVSFIVEPGEFVAIVGPTGCGKSTLLRLLLGFEDPQEGSVLYDGRDLADLDTSAVRRQCGVVLQSSQLFAGDLLSNIVGSSTFTIEDAWEAARMAGMKEDIEQMPMGMNTLLSEGASTLSGGQRQRLMIARALIAHPRIVFFDEATSALDNRTQAIVTSSMRELNATRIVIAHRLSTIQDADRIVVMHAGRVAQLGTFEELMAEPGPFRHLASRQIV